MDTRTVLQIKYGDSQGGVLVIAKGVTRGTLYKTNPELCQGELNAAQEKISPNLWHRRMDHMSEK